MTNNGFMQVFPSAGFSERLVRVVKERFGGNIPLMSDAAGVGLPYLHQILSYPCFGNGEPVQFSPGFCQLAGVSPEWLFFGRGEDPTIIPISFQPPDLKGYIREKLDELSGADLYIVYELVKRLADPQE